MDVVVLTLVLPAQAVTSSTGCYTTTHTLSSFTVCCNTSNSVKARMEICITYTLNVAFFFYLSTVIYNIVLVSSVKYIYICIYIYIYT